MKVGGSRSPRPTAARGHARIPAFAGKPFSSGRDGPDLIDELLFPQTRQGIISFNSRPRWGLV